MESELAEMSPEDKGEFLETLGVKDELCGLNVSASAIAITIQHISISNVEY